MTARTAAGLAALALALLAAAGCGGGGGSSASATTTVAATTTAGVKPSAAHACRQLNGAAESVVGRIGATLAGFKDVSSVGSLTSHVRQLRAQLNASAARINAISTPPGKLTHDRRQLASALAGLSQQVQKAERAAKAGRVGGAASEFSSAAQLTKLRKATQALGRDCPRVP